MQHPRPTLDLNDEEPLEEDIGTSYSPYYSIASASSLASSTTLDFSSRNGSVTTFNTPPIPPVPKHLGALSTFPHEKSAVNRALKTGPYVQRSSPSASSLQHQEPVRPMVPLTRSNTAPATPGTEHSTPNLRMHALELDWSVVTKLRRWIMAIAIGGRQLSAGVFATDSPLEQWSSTWTKDLSSRDCILLWSFNSPKSRTCAISRFFA